MGQEYILGTGDDELQRLGIQHRVWTEFTVAVWRRAGVRSGSKVLDLGCGPGYCTFDLAEIVGPSGLVLGVDESEGFVKYIQALAKDRSLGQVQSKVVDATKLSSVIQEKFDVVYCRWLLCWLKDPEAAIREVFQILKSGGRLVIHDYFNWKSMNVGPRSEAVEKMVLAALKSFEDRDGNADIAGDLLKVLRQSGFSVTHFDTIVRVARGGGLDSALDWPLTWWRSYGKKLVDGGRLDIKIYEQAQSDLNSLERDPDQFFFCPPLFEFIAEKK